jgi:NTE family protein
MKTRIVAAGLLFAALASCALSPDRYDGENAPRHAPIVPLRSERPLVALALGSGGARGFAHVGAIKALEAGGVVPDVVVGASSGAVVAALYAGGLNAAALERIAIDLDQDSLVDFVLFGKGWVRGEALQDFVNDALGGRLIEKLAKPFAVAATRARDGAGIVFNRGNTGVAVRASASVPNLFIPPVIHGEEYVDGGLTSPVPVRVAREMGADVVIAVDVSWFAQARMNGGGDMERANRRPRFALLETELAGADIVITPHTRRTRMLDFDRKLDNIAAGEAAARDALPEIRERIARAAERKRRLVRSPAAAGE